jgi:hypothetical protein
MKLRGVLPTLPHISSWRPARSGMRTLNFPVTYAQGFRVMPCTCVSLSTLCGIFPRRYLTTRHLLSSRDRNSRLKHLRSARLWAEQFGFSTRTRNAGCRLLTFVLHQIVYRSVRDSSVRIVTRYGLDGLGIESRCGRNFSHPSRPALWHIQARLQ